MFSFYHSIPLLNVTIMLQLSTVDSVSTFNKHWQM